MAATTRTITKLGTCREIMLGSESPWRPAIQPRTTIRTRIRTMLPAMFPRKLDTARRTPRLVRVSSKPFTKKRLKHAIRSVSEYGDRKISPLASHANRTRVPMVPRNDPSWRALFWNALSFPISINLLASQSLIHQRKRPHKQPPSRRQLVPSLVRTRDQAHLLQTVNVIDHRGILQIST